jgi:UDP-glucose 4-epimerase
MGSVVLVTGVSRDIARRFARSVAEHPDVDRVVGVDVVPPRGDIEGVTFHRADIRNPVIAKVIAMEDVDTVTEDMGPKRLPRSGYAKDVYEIEGYVRGFARRRPDVRVTMLRAANVIGRHVFSPLTSYFRLPVIPTVAGFDPRLQFLHEDDLVAALTHGVVTDVGGTFNIAGDGVLLLSQAVRRLRRPSVPLPGFALGAIGSVLRQAHAADFTPEQLGLLTYGRGVDTTRMRAELGFEPAYTTAEAFEDFGGEMSPVPGIREQVLTGLSSVLAHDSATEDAGHQPRLTTVEGARRG